MPGTLYLVATPIGNLDDMPPRVAATFGAADFIAAEDTRVTLRLLNHLGLKKPMVSYYEHALHHGEAILQRIEAGENCALCSDAGMPCISDPGEQIVKEAHARGIKVVPVPAASACVTALAASGQPTARFVFEGFLPVPKRERRERLDFLQKETRTMIFYEAPHKLRGTLDDLAVTFGTDRSVSLCRELTKLHEEIKKTTLGEAVAFYRGNRPHTGRSGGCSPHFAGRRYAALGCSQTGGGGDAIQQRADLQRADQVRNLHVRDHKNLSCFRCARPHA